MKFDFTEINKGQWRHYEGFSIYRNKGGGFVAYDATMSRKSSILENEYDAYLYGKSLTKNKNNKPKNTKKKIKL